jgi:aldose 1-epimerase
VQYAFRRWRLLLRAGVGVSVAVLAVAVASATGAPKRHPAPGGSPNIFSKPWGTVHNGVPVRLWTLESGHGMTVRITNYGGVVQSIYVPGRNRRVANVVLGFPRLSDYENLFEHQPWPAPGGSGNAYFGAIIGRYANRIANASFTLNGTTYHLPANNGPNTLHGGIKAYNAQVWSASEQRGKGFVALKLTYTDPDGYNGFPGAVSNTVTYRVTSDNALNIRYTATTTKPTVVNFTNHSYFNLAGEGSGDIYGQILQINSNTFTPIDANLIPTGFDSVAGTPFDFRRPKPIGRDIRNAFMRDGHQLVIAHGYDHNWVIKGKGLRLAAVARDPVSGRVLRTYTTEPGLQVYTSNFLVGDLVGTSGRTYRQGAAFTLETQHYPDSPHHIGDPLWPSVVLNPGQTFNSTTIFKFGVG